MVEDNIPLLDVGGVKGANCHFSKKYAEPELPTFARHPKEGLVTFDEARRDRKDVLMYVNESTCNYVWANAMAGHHNLFYLFLFFFYLSMVLLPPNIVTRNKDTPQSC